MSRPQITNFKGGRNRPQPAKPHLKFARLVKADQPAPPAKFDWLTAVPEDIWGMQGNDAVGDCTCAGVAHKRIGDVFVNQGKTLKVTAATTLKFYSAITGYKPSDPDSDQGALCQDVLAYWLKHGFQGEKIFAFAKVDLSDEAEVKRAISTFGQVYCGFNVPGTAMDQFNEGKPWSVVKGSQIEGGHCVTIGAYDADTYTAVTWGATQKMTKGFFKTYFDEMWVIVTEDMIDAKSGLDKYGLSLAALKVDFAALTA